MKTALALLCSASLILDGNAADTLLVGLAKKAAATLPRGCIVTAEQTGDASPVFSVVGQQEPAGVPPQKMIFEIGSISKVFTGMLLAQAVIEKKVKLDSTLRDLMGSTQTFADANVAAITLQQLATHTSGLPRIPDDLQAGGNMADPYAHYDRTRLDAFLSSAKLAHAPPFPSSYSNLGVGLLGDLLARLYGKSWDELVVERIAKPIGLTDTCVTLTDEQKTRLVPPYAGNQSAKAWHHTALAGSGALHSTAADMLKFVTALGRPGSTPLKEVIELTEQPRDEGAYGLCLPITKFKGQNGYWYQGGTGGYTSWISVKPASSHKIVMLINNAALMPEKVLMGKAAVSAKKPASTAPADATLADYVGVYDTGVKAGDTDIHYTFEARGSDLWMQVTGQSFNKLSRHPTAEDRFELKAVNAEIQFARKSGRVTSTTLFQAGLEIKATKLSAKNKTK